MTKFKAHVTASIDVEIEADDFAAAEQLANRIKAKWDMRSTWPTSHRRITATVSQYDTSNGAGIGHEYEPAPLHQQWPGPWSAEQAVMS